jgi:hypothetical protein
MACRELCTPVEITVVASDLSGLYSLSLYVINLGLPRTLTVIQEQILNSVPYHNHRSECFKGQKQR